MIDKVPINLNGVVTKAARPDAGTDLVPRCLKDLFLIHTKDTPETSVSCRATAGLYEQGLPRYLPKETLAMKAAEFATAHHGLLCSPRPVAHDPAKIAGESLLSELEL